MKDATDALSDHMNKLLELAELARYAGPEDRAWHCLLCLQRTSGYNARADAEEMMSRYGPRRLKISKVSPRSAFPPLCTTAQPATNLTMPH